MDKFLPKDQGKHDIFIILALAVPLMVAGVIWGIVEGGYDDTPPTTGISAPAPSPAASPTFVSTPED